MLPTSGLAAVRQDNEGVVPEQLRNGLLVILQVVFVGVFDLPVALLEFDEDQGQTIDEANEIGTAFVDAAGYPELGGEKEVVVLWIIPVDDSNRLVRLFAFVILKRTPSRHPSAACRLPDSPAPDSWHCDHGQVPQWQD